MVTTSNIAIRLDEMAAAHPQRDAVIVATRAADAAGMRRCTFAELNALINHYAARLRTFGIESGMRVILMVRPGVEFFALTFGLMRIGAVPVLIDPGMGKRSLVRCLAGVEAQAFVGIPLAHVMRRLFQRAFRTVRIAVTLGRRWAWGGFRIEAFETLRDALTPAGIRDVASSDGQSNIAAILFTTGSTGPPKGVVYHHATFDAQVRILRDRFGLAPGQVDLATFPLFALFDAALGVTAVIPDMNPTRPGFVDPRVIIDTVNTMKCTNMFGSPALLDRVASLGSERLPTLRRVISAGAAVRADILRRFSAMLPSDAEIFTPYGATESLPVAVISHREIIGGASPTEVRSALGHGTCVGRPLPENAVRIIRIDDEPITQWTHDLELMNGEIGEIAVRGPVVTREYFHNSSGTALAKIATDDGIWHRMGDVGYVDADGRLWFCGRKAHRVETRDGNLFTEPIEALFNQIPGVRRSALVGVGARPNQTPVVLLEAARDGAGRSLAATLADQLRVLRARDGAAAKIERVEIYDGIFPVDIRHNAKIFRERLAEWASRRIR